MSSLLPKHMFLQRPRVYPRIYGVFGSFPGVSVLLGPVLRQVPLPVLFGIFLYMGIASMSGIQMLHRVQLMFVPVKHHPDVGYARRVCGIEQLQL